MAGAWLVTGLAPAPALAALSGAKQSATSPLAKVNYILHGFAVAPPGRSLQKASKGESVLKQYSLRTLKGQKASLRFFDGTALLINENTDAVLASATTTRVSHGEAAVYLKPGTNHQVTAGSAVASAIGTEYDIQVVNDRARFVVLHGALRVTSAGHLVVVKSNFQTFVSPNTAPLPPSPVDAKAVFAWSSGIPTPDLGEDVSLDANGGTIEGFSSELAKNGKNGDVHHIDDGLLTEGWISAAGKTTNQFVKVGFYIGNTYRISGVIIDPAATDGASSTEDLKDFEIRVSTSGTKNGDFISVFHGTCKRSDRLQGFVFRVAMQARYVELVALSNYGSARGVAVAEWEVVASESLLYGPQGMALDGRGDMCIADRGNNRIMKLSPKGKRLAAWGKKGSGAGQFIGPSAVGLDQSGNVYVADTYNGRVQELSPNGKPVASWGSAGSNPGQLFFPDGVAVDAARNVYVSDLRNRIQKFSHDGRLLSVWDSFGALGTLKMPAGMDISPSGMIAVADAGNGRVLVLRSDGSVERTFSAKLQAGEPNHPSAVAFDPAGGMVVANGYGLSAIVLHVADDGTQTVISSVGFGAGQVIGSYGVAADSAGNVYATDSASSRVLKFSATGKLLATWGKYATVANALGQPFGIAIDTHGFIYVTDVTNDRVQVRSPSGSVVAIYGHHGNPKQRTAGLGQFWSLRGVAIGPDGAIYVADSGNFRVQVLANRGPIASVGGDFGTPSFLGDPTGVAVDSHSNLYVTQLSDTDVKVFSPAGTLLRTIVGPQGSGPGRFTLPYGIAIDNRDDVYVSYELLNEVEKFNADGRLLAVWGAPGQGNVHFNYPRGIALDSGGNVYVTNLFGANLRQGTIEKIAPNGSQVQVFTLPDFLSSPLGVAVDPAGNVYVTDEMNEHIVKFSPSGAVLAVWN
jgi:sugar lactone lactonase YvrE